MTSSSLAAERWPWKLCLVRPAFQMGLRQALGIHDIRTSPVEPKRCTNRLSGPLADYDCWASQAQYGSKRLYRHIVVE